MAPTWVMLQRSVSLLIEDGDDEVAAAAAEKQKGTADPSVQDLLGSLKPDNRGLHAPPRISSFGLRGRTKPGIDLVREAYGTSVACADKSLLVLYGGKYEGPGSSTSGCYLVYDAAAAGTGPLATVPPIPRRFGLNPIGVAPVVMRRHHPRAGGTTTTSSYLLAELASTIQPDLPHAELYLWCSDAPTPQWIMKEVLLPREVAWEPGKHLFSVDTTFSIGTSRLCWVDLLQGILVCDNPDRQDPHFRFIPLPDECAGVATCTSEDRTPRPRMHQYRSVRYICGHIKLVAIEGLLEGWASDKYRVAIWTLKSSLGVEWERGDMFPIQDIWAKDKYQALKLPQHTPACPVLCESGDVYIIVMDLEVKDIFRGLEHISTDINVKGQYVLELDMQRNDITSISQVPPENVGHLMPDLFATDFIAYLPGFQSQEESCEAGMRGLKVV